jgi:hypothetical protein
MEKVFEQKAKYGKESSLFALLHLADFFEVSGVDDESVGLVA